MPQQPEAEQLRLFDVGVDMRRLQQRREELTSWQRTPNTLKAYAHGWEHFVRWCSSAGRAALPASPETVALHLCALLEDGHRLATAELRASAIAYYHRAEGFASPKADPAVRQVLSGARRRLKERPRGKAAMTVDQLRRGLKLERGRGPVGVRNAAMLLLGFAGGFRRSEVVGLDLEDVAFVKQGLRVTIRHSKTDQEAKGRVVGLPFGCRSETCPVRALRGWLAVRGRSAGPLFQRMDRWGNVTGRPITGQTLNQAAKAAAVAAGCDAAAFGAHSLRAGCVTAATENGASVFAIMERTGHKDLKTVQRYVRPATAFASDPLRKVL